MRIAQVAPLVESIPPKKYGGTERVVSVLTEELVKRGHDVTLFATGDSTTSARLHAAYPRAQRLDFPAPSIQRSIWGLRSVGVAYTMQDDFDIIHDHTQWLGASVANISKTPVIMTLHGAITDETKALFESLRNPYLVSISNAQREPAPELNYIGTVYNGMPTKEYPYSSGNDGYLLYVGRICEEKSPHLAIKVAQVLNLPLIMAAKVEEGRSKEYFLKHVKPYLSKKIQWIGEVDEKERNRLFSRALCSLHPVMWPEPFGLTLIEAMSCGSPVIAFNKGSIPEVIQDGRTGFVVQSVEEMIAAVKKIHTINRLYCRLYAQKNFSAEKMTDGYESVYKRILRERYEGAQTIPSDARWFVRDPHYAAELQ